MYTILVEIEPHLKKFEDWKIYFLDIEQVYFRMKLVIYFCLFQIS